MLLSTHKSTELTNMQKAQFEIVARNEYMKGDFKNPVNCSLFYLALKKKAVLQGLWRMASWNKEQRATQKLLANNFADPKWQETALKNAYALLSKRRFGEQDQYAPSTKINANSRQNMPQHSSSLRIVFKMPSMCV